MKDTNQFLQDIQKIQLLTQEEESTLIKKINKENKEEDRNKLVESMLRYILSIARKVSKDEDAVVDLVNEGALAVLYIIDKFDVDKGIRFNSYAHWFIERAMYVKLDMERPDTVIEARQLKKIRLAQKTREKYYMEKGQYPTPQTLSSLSGFSVNQLEALETQSNMSVHSMDGVSSENNEDDFYMLEMATDTTPETELMKKENSEELASMLLTLSEREQKVIVLNFGLFGTKQLNLEEIAENLGITKRKVRYAKQEGLEKLKKRANYLVFA